MPAQLIFVGQHDALAALGNHFARDGRFIDVLIHYAGLHVDRAGADDGVVGEKRLDIIQCDRAQARHFGVDELPADQHHVNGVILQTDVGNQRRVGDDR